MKIISFIPIILALALAPLLLGVINRTKALFAGRTGQPFLQAYYDLIKLLQKGAVYSQTTTWVFRAGPIVGLAAVLMAIPMLPLGSIPALVAFPGDLLLFACLLGLMRFCTVLAALDTGSSFEGMGASREVQFAMLAEPAFLLSLATLARQSSSLSLTTILGNISLQTWLSSGIELALVGVALFIIFLTENARIPIDDPNTHLELTMIHEVMALDHGGPDFAFIQYSAALKLWALGSIIMNIALPVRTGRIIADSLIAVVGMLLLAVVVGVVESIMARLRLVRVPHLLAGASAFAVLAMILVLRF